MPLPTSPAIAPVSAEQYTNPVSYLDGQTRTNPDPFVLRHLGRYWCYSTDDLGVNVSVSLDMVSWQYLGLAYTHPGRRQYWAPCVSYAQGRWWMYVSHRPEGSDDPHEEYLHVAVAEQPQGPFTTHRQLFETFSIDPHVVRDPESGEYVMFYSTNDVTGLEDDSTGTAILVDQMVAMDQLAGRPQPVVVPTLDEEIFERNRFGDGRDWYTIEGASYFTRRGMAYLTYSGNAYVGEHYFIGYSRAPVTGAIPSLSWSKYPSDFDYEPLVRRSTQVEGTGHNSIVRAPNLVDDWIVYHGRDGTQAMDPEREERVMRIDPIHYDGLRLTTPAPTAGPHGAPAPATVADLLDRAALGDHWQEIAGTFTATPAHRGGPGFVQTGGDLECVLGLDHLSCGYIAEVSLRAARRDTGARCGVHLVHHDPDNYVALWLDAATDTAIVSRTRSGICAELARVDLGGFTPDWWHLLHIERTYDRVRVLLDERSLVDLTIGDETPGRIALASIGTSAQFAGFSLTDHIDLAGQDLSHLHHLFAAHRTVAVTDDALAARTRRPLRLDGDAPAHASTTFDVDILAPSGYATVILETGDTTMRLTKTAGAIQVTITQAGSTTTVVADPHPHRRASLCTTRDARGVHVRIGAQTHTLPIAVAPGHITQRLELAGAALHGVERTARRPHRA